MPWWWGLTCKSSRLDSLAFKEPLDGQTVKITCPRCAKEFISSVRGGSFRCPFCHQISQVVRLASSTPGRLLNLVAAKGYHYMGHTFRAHCPQEISNPQHYQQLVATGLFQEIPPSERWALQYTGIAPQITLKTQVGETTFHGHKIIWKEPWEATALIKKNSVIKRIPNRELLKTLATKKSFRALFVRDMGLGDIFIFNACLADFRRQYPQAQITAVTRPDYMFVLQEVADQVLPLLDLYDAQDYEITANLCRKSEEHPAATKVLRADIYASHMGFTMQDYTMQFTLPGIYKQKAQDLLVQRGWDGHKKLVGIQVHGSSYHRTWPLSYQKILARLLRQAGHEVVFCHGRREEQWDGQGINLTGETDLLTLCGVWYWCDVVVGPDSSHYHIKEAVGNGQAVAIFSTIDPDLRLRHYRHTLPLWEGYEQKMMCGGPCFDHGCAPLHCLRFWSASKVADRIFPLLEKKGE